MTSELDFPGEKEQIQKVVQNSVSWALQKDKELLLASVAQDPCFFIFNPDNRSTIVGFKAFRDLVENVYMHPAYRATGFEINDMRINLSKSGEAAWFSARLNDRGEWNGQPTSWENVRWTGVLEKRNGKWLIVQMHFSFASDTDYEETSEGE